MNNLGFIGLGLMGGNVCRCLLEKGHTLTVYDADKATLDTFADGANLANDPGGVFAACEIIFLSLPNSEVVESVMAEVLNANVRGKTVIDLSTSYPLSTKKLHEQLKALECSLLDAPLLAGPEEARAGVLQMMVGGDFSDFEKHKPLLECFCTKIDYMGPSGSAHAVKIMMNFTGLMYALLLGQMFPLAEKLEINPHTLYNVMDNEIFGNWVYRFYSPKMIDRTYDMAFALELGMKDLNYMKMLYDQFGASAYALDGGLKLLEQAVKDGKGKLDFSQLASVVYKELGL